MATESRVEPIPVLDVWTLLGVMVVGIILFVQGEWVAWSILNSTLLLCQTLDRLQKQRVR